LHEFALPRELVQVTMLELLNDTCALVAWSQTCVFAAHDCGAFDVVIAHALRHHDPAVLARAAGVVVPASTLLHARRWAQLGGSEEDTVDAAAARVLAQAMPLLRLEDFPAYWVAMAGGFPRAMLVRALRAGGVRTAAAVSDAFGDVDVWLAVRAPVAELLFHLLGPPVGPSHEDDRHMRKLLAKRGCQKFTPRTPPKWSSGHPVQFICPGEQVHPKGEDARMTDVVAQFDYTCSQVALDWRGSGTLLVTPAAVYAVLSGRMFRNPHGYPHVPDWPRAVGNGSMRVAAYVLRRYYKLRDQQGYVDAGVPDDDDLRLHMLYAEAEQLADLEGWDEDYMTLVNG
jgi:hypothetical protein